MVAKSEGFRPVAGALQISLNRQQPSDNALFQLFSTNTLHALREDPYSKTHLSVGQSRSLLQGAGGVLKLLELLQLHQASSALGGAGLGGQIIALEQLLVLGLEEGVTGRGFGEDEEGHFCWWTLARRGLDGMGEELGRWINRTSD